MSTSLDRYRLNSIHFLDVGNIHYQLSSFSRSRSHLENAPNGTRPLFHGNQPQTSYPLRSPVETWSIVSDSQVQSIANLAERYVDLCPRCVLADVAQPFLYNPIYCQREGRAHLLRYAAQCQFYVQAFM